MTNMVHKFLIYTKPISMHILTYLTHLTPDPLWMTHHYL